MNKITLFLAMFLFSGIANAEMLNSKHIYSFAKSGDYRSLGRYSRWIDITNSDGDTAVCLAIRNNDVNSYNLLLSYGANSRPSCYASAIKSASGSVKDGTFLGMSGTGWAVTGGVLAAGGIAAAAGGGGGGGSGSSSSQPDQVVCSNHSSLVDGVCQCNAGYTGSQCETCDDGYTKYNGSCYKKLACNANQHQEANNCVCDNNYIEQNGTCYRKLSCVNGSQNKNECICDFGYTGSFCNEADENHIIGGDGNLYDKLNCVNGSQVNASCKCADGWSGATCETAVTCDYDTVECAYGYKETGSTCKSGNTTYKECVFDDVNFIQQGGSIYPKLDCKNGGVQDGAACTGCNTGWTGTLCDTSADCGANYKETCASNEYTTGETCPSGGNTLKKCLLHSEMPNCQTLSSTSDTCEICKTGYAGTTCSQAADGYTLFDGIAYQKLACANGSQNKDKCICNSGWGGKLCDARNTCEYNTTECKDGYVETGKTCTSGDLIYKECKEREVPAGYTTESCREGYKQVDTFLSGTQTYYKCEADSCVGYDYIVCPTGYAQSDSCLSGLTMKYKCGICANGYGKDEKGNCVLKKADKIEGMGEANNFEFSSTVNGYTDLYAFKGAANARTDLSKGDKKTGKIEIIKNGDGDFYGVFSNYFAYNADADYAEYGGTKYASVANGTIKLEKNGDGNVYAIWGKQSMNNASVADGGTATGNIEILNNGYGNIYGGYSPEDKSINASSSKGTGIGSIKIFNNGDGNTYGLLSDASTGTNAYSLVMVKKIQGSSTTRGCIIINNTGNGDVYGIKGASDVYNTYNMIMGANSYSDDIKNGSTYTDGYIRIKNSGIGNSYGLYGENTYSSSFEDRTQYKTKVISTQNSNSLIDILNLGKGNAYGMYALGTTSEIAHVENRTYSGSLTDELGHKYPDNTYSATSNIKILNNDNGFVVGIYSKGNVINDGNITIHNLGEGTAIGIYADHAIKNSKITNTGSINITRVNYIDDNSTQDDTSDDKSYTAASMTGGTSIGIYAASGSTIKNVGTITISGAQTSYGIYAESGTTVKNSGKIIIDGKSCTGANCTSTNNAIKLNGGTLFQDGKLLVQNSQQSLMSLNFDDMGGKVVATEKAVFEVNGAIAGHLTMSSDIVSKGFKDTYTTNGTIDAEDTSGLCLVSQSALFHASLAENNSDVVMKMKSFDKVVDNKSLAGFLQSNYALENNELFFNTLKKQETKTSLNNALDDLSGKKLFSRFADEDLTMMRELTFDVNNKLFMNNDDHLETSGNISTFNFSSNKGSDNRYALISQNYGNYKLGLNYGFANVRSDDDDNNRRNERMFHIGMPISYGKQGFKFITTPHLGYSSGTYNRKGFNNENYEGNVEKTMFGLVNEARYPFTLGKWTIAPGTEFNVVDYRTQGHEKGGTYKLRLASQNNYSVEAGVGLYANAEHKFSEKSKLTFTNGLTMYHEFADPYKMQVGVYKMSGKFDIRDEKRSDNRAVIRTGLSYVNDNISLSGNVMSYIDKEYRTNAVLDFKYAF